HIFQDVYEGTRNVVREGDPRDIPEAIAAMQRISMDIPEGRARALWQAISAAGTGESEIAELSRHLRHLLIKTTRPMLEKALGISQEQAGPLAWMLIGSFWGARQMKDAGELSREEALQMHGWLAGCVANGERRKLPQVGNTPGAADRG